MSRCLAFFSLASSISIGRDRYDILSPPCCSRAHSSAPCPACRKKGRTQISHVAAKASLPESLDAGESVKSQSVDSELYDPLIVFFPYIWSRALKTRPLCLCRASRQLTRIRIPCRVTAGAICGPSRSARPSHVHVDGCSLGGAASSGDFPWARFSRVGVLCSSRFTRIHRAK